MNFEKLETLGFKKTEAYVNIPTKFAKRKDKKTGEEYEVGIEWRKEHLYNKYSKGALSIYDADVILEGIFLNKKGIIYLNGMEVLSGELELLKILET